MVDARLTTVSREGTLEGKCQMLRNQTHVWKCATFPEIIPLPRTKPSRLMADANFVGTSNCSAVSLHARERHSV